MTAAYGCDPRRVDPTDVTAVDAEVPGDAATPVQDAAKAPCDDEAVVGTARPCGSCWDGVQLCAVAGWTACLGASDPADERCNGADDDCDGRIDEAPAYTGQSAIASPSLVPPTGLAWTGESWMVSLRGYPNWLVQMSAVDGTVWSTARYGLYDVSAVLAAHRDGLALAWIGNDQGIWYAFRDTQGAPGLDGRRLDALRPDESRGRLRALSIDATTPAVVLSWQEGGDADTDGEVRIARVWAPTGDVRDLPGPLGAGRAPLLVAQGEDGWLVAYRRGPQVVLQRVDAMFAPAESTTTDHPTPGAPVAVGANPYLAEILLVWVETIPGQRIRAQRFDRALRPVADPVVVTERTTPIHAVQLVRRENDYGLFWSEGADPATATLWGRVIEASTRALTPDAPWAGPAAAHVVARGIEDFGVAWLDDGHLRLSSGPLGCAPPGFAQ